MYKLYKEVDGAWELVGTYADINEKYECPIGHRVEVTDGGASTILMENLPAEELEDTVDLL